MSRAKQKDSTLDPAGDLKSKAEEQGYLTIDDVLAVYPQAEKNLPQLERLLAYLYDEGIEITANRGKQDTKLAQTDKLDAQDRDQRQTFDLSGISTNDTISLYLKEMASVPLLTAKEEIRLAKRIERGKIAERQLQGDVQNLSSRNELSREVEIGDAARAHLISANTRLVVSIAKRYMGQGVPFLDLIQEGNLGLMKAVSRFDYRRGCKFSTYATWWIRQSVTRSLAEQGRVIRLPSHVGDRIRRVYRTAQHLEQDSGQRASPEEIATNMGLNADKVRFLIGVSRRPLSLEKPVGEEQDSELGQFIEDEDSPTPTDEAARTLLSEQMEEVLSTLRPRQARILRLRFGLHDGREYTLKEVGDKFGLTRERIRQIERDALRRLRHPSRTRPLEGYISR